MIRRVFDNYILIFSVLSNLSEKCSWIFCFFSTYLIHKIVIFQKMDNLFGKDDSDNESEHVEVEDKNEKFDISQKPSTSKDIENMDIDVLPIKVNYYIVV